MLVMLLENVLLRVGPWRALGAIFALGLVLIVAILIGQPDTTVAPPSELPLAPPGRQQLTARAAVAGQPAAEPAASESAAAAALETATAAEGLPTSTPDVAQAPGKPPDDQRAAQEALRQAIVGRLGDTRQSIESFIGPPASHLSGQEFLYRAPTRFTITYSHSGRVQLFTIWSPRDASRHPLQADVRDWTLSHAREIASLFLPLDAQPLQTRKGFLGQPEDVYFSEALGQAVGRADYVLAGAKGPAGSLGVLFTLTDSGTVSMFTIGIR
ncbi:MAG: hypothetical protein HY691_07665 [Chloroflexi bacterium]|nr:hypothetical protein [Chloroflexota bacterium]